jgi:hypothetical protein
MPPEAGRLVRRSTARESRNTGEIGQWGASRDRAEADASIQCIP